MSITTTLRVFFGMTALLIVVAALLYLIAIKPPRIPNGPISQSDLTAWFDDLVQSKAAAAVSVAVLRDGKVVWEHAAGQANPIEGQAATPETVYHVWSITKVATALAVLDLTEDGILDLDTAVSEILPWLGVEESSGRKMTVRDLLRHTSGLRDTVPAVFGWVRFDEVLPNQTDYLRSRIPDYRTLRFTPGEGRRYSNLGYMVLGAIIEEVTGKDYEDVIRERVLAPAGMTSTDFVFSSELAPHEALGTHPIIHIFSPLLPFLIDMSELVHTRKGQLLLLNRLYVEATPPTGLIASARDVALLANAAMAAGIVLDENMISLMIPERREEFPLGWYERGGGEQSWFQHRGGGPGFAAAVRVYPTEGLVIAVLASGTAALTADVANLIAAAKF